MRTQCLISHGPRICKSFAMAAFLLLVAGCGGGGVTDTPKLGSVTGKVTLDGAPLVGAKVTFVHTDGKTALATTDAAGKYQAIYGATPGAVIGDNTVKITAEPKREHNEDGSLKETGASAIPAKYNTESTLKVTVKAGSNTFDFDLKTT